MKRIRYNVYTYNDIEAIKDIVIKGYEAIVKSFKKFFCSLLGRFQCCIGQENISNKKKQIYIDTAVVPFFYSVSPIMYQTDCIYNAYI